eukprot:1145016-Rhodomonas_salina.1
MSVQCTPERIRHTVCGTETGVSRSVRKRFSEFVALDAALDETLPGTRPYSTRYPLGPPKCPRVHPRALLALACAIWAARFLNRFQPLSGSMHRCVRAVAADY